MPSSRPSARNSAFCFCPLWRSHEPDGIVIVGESSRTGSPLQLHFVSKRSHCATEWADGNRTATAAVWQSRAGSLARRVPGFGLSLRRKPRGRVLFSLKARSRLDHTPRSLLHKNVLSFKLYRLVPEFNDSIIRRQRGAPHGTQSVIVRMATLEFDKFCPALTDSHPLLCI